jgi:hypothetical protein
LFSSHNIEQRGEFVLKWLATQPSVYLEPGLRPVFHLERTETHKSVFNIHQAFLEMEVCWFFDATPYGFIFDIFFPQKFLPHAIFI